MAKKKTKAPTLSDELRAWRERVGYTQNEAADALGVGLRTYHGWENGEGVWHPRVLLLATERIESERVAEEAA